MEKQGRTWIVLALLAVAVATIGLLSGKMPPPKTGETASPPVGSPTAEASAPLSDASPDLSQVNPVQFLDMIPVGQPAPNFTTTDVAGKPVTLASFKGKKNVVLIFFQGSFCSVCGHQLENIQAHLSQIRAKDAEVLAISADDVQHSKKTKGEHGLDFEVIPDPNRKLIREFGVANITRQNIAFPTAYVIDKKGIVRLSYAHPQGQRIQSDGLLDALNKIQ